MAESAEEKELEAYATKMADRLKKFKGRVDQLEEMREERTADRAKIIEECEDLKASIKTARKGLKTSLLSVDAELQEKYEARLEKMTEQYKEYERMYKFYAGRAERSDLLDGGKDVGGRRAPGAAAGNDEYLDAAKAIEERTTGKLAGVLQTANMAEEIAISTAGKMVENRETIGKIHSNVLAVDENLDTANKLITRFVKRLYTDKVIIAFVFLIVVAIAAIIVYATLYPSQTTFTVPDVVKPPSTGSAAAAAGNALQRFLRE